VGTWHLTRSGWAPVNTGNLVLFKASVASANDIWATGADITDHGLRITPVVARWNGSAWVQHRSISAALPKPASQTGVSADAIKAFSPGSVWVQAFVEAHAGAIGVVVVHGTGAGGRRANRARPGYPLPTAVPDGHDGGWAPPFVENLSAPYLLHEANGRWTRFPLPVRGGLGLDSFSLAQVPHTASMLAAGSSNHGGVVLTRERLPAEPGITPGQPLPGLAGPDVSTR